MADREKRTRFAIDTLFFDSLFSNKVYNHHNENELHRENKPKIELNKCCLCKKDKAKIVHLTRYINKLTLYNRFFLILGKNKFT